MSKAMIGRLILEASTGMHGEESKILADAWADMAQQRSELLEALKDVMSAVELGWIPDGESMFNARAAIAKATGANND